jgi:acetyl-CoA carboxylase biotin carboxyl carrier protein
VEINWEQLRELITTLDRTDITEFSLESEAWKLNIRKSDRGQVVTAVSAPTVLPTVPEPPALTPEPAVANKKTVDIISPMVGTFYRAPAPDEPPFVEVGDTVQRGDTVCIVEAMKTMNTVEADTGGRIVEILVQNGQPVEFHQVLMRVEI